MSVGTLYQYFPQKEALLFAVLQRHLSALSDLLVQAAESTNGETLETMVKTVVGVFIREKTCRIDVSRALYAVAGELDTRGFVRQIETRNRAAFAKMLDTASDARFDDIATTAFMFAAAQVGPTRMLLEGQASAATIRKLRAHIERLCLNYLRVEAWPRTKRRRQIASPPDTLMR